MDVRRAGKSVSERAASAGSRAPSRPACLLVEEIEHAPHLVAVTAVRSIHVNVACILDTTPSCYPKASRVSRITVLPTGRGCVSESFSVAVVARWVSAPAGHYAVVAAAAVPWTAGALRARTVHRAARNTLSQVHRSVQAHGSSLGRLRVRTCQRGYAVRACRGFSAGPGVRCRRPDPPGVSESGRTSDHERWRGRRRRQAHVRQIALPARPLGRIFAAVRLVGAGRHVGDQLDEGGGSTARAAPAKPTISGRSPRGATG